MPGHAAPCVYTLTWLETLLVRMEAGDPCWEKEEADDVASSKPEAGLSCGRRKQKLKI